MTWHSCNRSRGQEGMGPRVVEDQSTLWTCLRCSSISGLPVCDRLMMKSMSVAEAEAKVRHEHQGQGRKELARMILVHWRNMQSFWCLDECATSAIGMLFTSRRESARSVRSVRSVCAKQRFRAGDSEEANVHVGWWLLSGMPRP